MRLRRLLAATLVVAAASVGTASIGAGAQPAAAVTPTATVVVAPDDGGVVRKGQDLGVVVSVTNSSTTALPAGRIATSLDRAPVASTSSLLSVIADPPDILQGRLTRATGTVPALAAGASTTVRLTLRSEDVSSIFTGASGARLLYAGYVAGDAHTIAVSSVVRMAGDATGRVALGSVVPVTAPPTTTGVVDVATQQELAAPGGAWSDALRAAEASPSATVALDPAVIASIRLAGDAAPQDAVGFLADLADLPNEVVRLPYADADVALERAAGANRTLAPSSFAGVTAAAPAAAASGGATPAPTATAGAAATSVDGLLDWRWSDQEVAWPLPHTASAADVRALGAAGAAVLLPSDDVGDTPARRSAGPVARIGSTTVLVADATVSSLLTAASGEGARGDAALATLTGVLATAAVTGETSTLLATVGRASSTARLGRVLSVLQRQPWIRERPLSEIATGTATGVQLRRARTLADRVATAEDLMAAEQRVQDLGKAITSGADAVVAPRRLALVGMLSSSWRGDDGAWRAAASTVQSSFEALAGRVRLSRQSAPNFVGSDGSLRVYVRNGLPAPVTMVVDAGVSNGALQFTGSSSVTIRVPAGGQNRGDLHFRSIRNGRTDLTLRLTTPDGTTIGRSTIRGATVRAGFDTIVAVALLVALGLLLALGVYRNVKRRGQPRPATAA